MFNYDRSLSWAKERYKKKVIESNDCCPILPDYNPRHPRLRRIVGKPERLLQPVPPEWGQAVREYAGPATDFLLTLTPEEWAEGKFEERRFAEWRSSLPKEVRRECPASPRAGAIIEHLRKRAEREGRAAEADPLLRRLLHRLTHRGEARVWAVVADDPLSILEMGRAAEVGEGYSFESCQCYTPSGFSHHLMHQLAPNLLDPGMAVLAVTNRRFTQMVRRPLARVILRLVRTYRGSGGRFTWGVLVDRWYGPRAYERPAMEYLFRLARQAGLEVFLPAVKPYGMPECLEPAGDPVKVRGVRWVNTCTAYDEEEGEVPVAPYLDQADSLKFTRIKFRAEDWRLVQLRGLARRAALRDA